MTDNPTRSPFSTVRNDAQESNNSTMTKKASEPDNRSDRSDFDIIESNCSVNELNDGI